MPVEHAMSSAADDSQVPSLSGFFKFIRPSFTSHFASSSCLKTTRLKGLPKDTAECDCANGVVDTTALMTAQIACPCSFPVLSASVRQAKTMIHDPKPVGPKAMGVAWASRPPRHA